MKKHYLYELAEDVKQYATEDEKEAINKYLHWFEINAASSMETLALIMNAFKK